MQEGNKSLLYFAYGEHMNEEEMQRDFPHARMVGLSRLEGFSLSFVGRDGMARAALMPNSRGSVPGRVWSLMEEDAEALDRIADDPFFARREVRFVSIDGITLPVLVYITVPGQQYGRPSFITYTIMREAYEQAGEDIDQFMALAAMKSVP